MSIKEYNITHTQMGGGELKEDLGGGSSALTPATTDTLGGVKIGNGISVTEDGTISAQGGSMPVKILDNVMSIGTTNIGPIDFENPPILFTLLQLFSCPVKIEAEYEGEQIAMISYGTYGNTSVTAGENISIVMTVYQDESTPNFLMNPTGDVYVNISYDQSAADYATKAQVVAAGTDYVAYVGIDSSRFQANVTHNKLDTKHYISLEANFPLIADDDLVVCYPRTPDGIDYNSPAEMKNVYKNVTMIAWAPRIYDSGSYEAVGNLLEFIPFGYKKGDNGYGGNRYEASGTAHTSFGSDEYLHDVTFTYNPPYGSRTYGTISYYTSYEPLE